MALNWRSIRSWQIDVREFGLASRDSCEDYAGLWCFCCEFFCGICRKWAAFCMDPTEGARWRQAHLTSRSPTHLRKRILICKYVFASKPLSICLSGCLGLQAELGFWRFELSWHWILWFCCGQTFEFTADPEQMRAPRNVTVGLIQNAIVLPTTSPFLQQKHAIFERVGRLIDVAAKAGVNVLCLQVLRMTLIWPSIFLYSCICLNQRYWKTEYCCSHKFSVALFIALQCVFFQFFFQRLCS